MISLGTPSQLLTKDGSYKDGLVLFDLMTHTSDGRVISFLVENVCSHLYSEILVSVILARKESKHSSRIITATKFVEPSSSPSIIPSSLKPERTMVRAKRITTMALVGMGRLRAKLSSTPGFTLHLQ